MLLRAPEPPRGNANGRLARGVGIFGILVGAAIVIGTATGRIQTGGADRSIGYMVGGITAAYGLLRFLRGNLRGRDGLN